MLAVTGSVVGEDQAARQNHLGQVAPAEPVSQPRESYQQHNRRRERQTVAGRARALIEGTSPASVVVPSTGFFIRSPLSADVHDEQGIARSSL